LTSISIKLLIASVGLLAVSIPAQSQPNNTVDPSFYESLRFRTIGPDGNRTDTTTGVPGDPLTYYVGAASGGIWKSSDGGDSWNPIFDDQDVSSIGALAVAPSDSAIVWAGTGEPFIRSHISVGNGMYKSIDAGKTWKRVGLENTGRISRVLIDPHNPNIVFACALGHAYTPQPDRGVFRTTDGGATWQKVLFADENTGCSDLAFSPASSHVLLAGMWQLEIHPWGRSSGGPLGGIYKSIDGGSTWKLLNGHGLPHSPVGKVALAYAPSDANRVYAQIETGDGLPFQGNPPQSGSLWRSEDGGDNWRLVSHDRRLAGRFHYFARHAVNPTNENEIYFLSTVVSISYDGGLTSIDSSNPQGGPGRGFDRFRDSRSVGQDNHDIWIDPDGKRIIIAGDFGVSISLNRGKTWVKKNLPIAQMYHVTTDNKIPYNVFGNKQDGPSYGGPSNALEGVGIPRAAWHAVGGGESGFATPDPTDPNIIWSSASGAGSVGGIVVRFDQRTRRSRDVEVWPESTTGASAAEVKYRFQWTFPLEISPFDHNRIYVGSQFVHMTTDGGQSWHEISPDLTLNDRSKMGVSGGLTPDQIGVEYGSVIYAITESPKQKGLIWVGTNDGLVQLTRDEGKTWSNVTANIPGLPPWGQVYHIEASRKDAGVAYVTFDLHQMGNFDPFVYKTSDYGKTWKPIVNGIAKSPVSYAHCLREDPKRPGLLYLGTENGLYVSFNDGENWQSLQLNLPHAPVYWITVQEQFNDLVLATYGRGFWILDDLAPIQQLTPELLNSGVKLLAPRPAYRFQLMTNLAQTPNDPCWGDDPPYGASINFFLKAAPKEPAKITISDASGKAVRTLTVPAHAGINRVNWDLRSERSTEIRLQTVPVGAPEFMLGPDGTRSLGGRASIDILEPPGTYAVELSAGGGPPSAQKLVVLKDPNSGGSEAEIAEQNQLSLKLKDTLNTAAESVNVIESLRSQIVALKRAVGANPAQQAIIASSADLDRKLLKIEDVLIKTRATGAGSDMLRYSPEIIDKLGYLGAGIASSDYRPTDQDQQVYELLRRQLSNPLEELSSIFAKDVAGFNSVLRERGVPGGLIVTRPK
jgi:photosystem II stability/assembly factor-like uncharacterized protein